MSDDNTILEVTKPGKFSAAMNCNACPEPCTSKMRIGYYNQATVIRLCEGCRTSLAGMLNRWTDE